MPSLANSPLRLFQRLFDPKTPRKPTENAVDTVIDGATAVAIMETCLADAAALNASFPVNTATITWQAEQSRKGINCFGAPLTSQRTESPRGALAAAMGLAMSGMRATVFLSGPELISGQDLLVMAAGRHLPLVVHLSNQTLAAQAGALGTGHETYHITADSGCFTLLATNVQEAVDLTLIARRTAELSLIPGIVAMDGEQTTLAVQDVSLPSSTLICGFLGPSHEKIQAPTPAQRVIFGETRRRVPCWHDLDRPVLHGALQGPESWGLGAVAKPPYFDRHVAGLLNESASLLAEHTGRHLLAISTYRTQNADIVLVTQGSTTETVQAVADYMRRRRGMRIGVIGIRCLRPFPGPQIAEALRGKHIVGVLERSDTPLAADPPLTRQLRSAIDRALENNRFGRHTHPHYPVISDHEHPRLRSVLFGLGGLPLRGADLIALCEELARNIEKAKPERWYKTRFDFRDHQENASDKEVEQVRSRIYLGFDFARASSVYPKRQVLLDILRRDYPEIANLGLRGQDAPPDLRPKGTITLAIHRIPGQGAEGLAIEAAEFLHKLRKGGIRTDPGLYWERFESYCVDRLNVGPLPLRDPGNQVPLDMSIVTTPRHHLFMKPIADLVQNGVLMVESPLDGEVFWHSLPPILREGIRIKQAILYRISPPVRKSGLELSKERLLGAMLGAMGSAGKLSFSTERCMETRADILRSLPLAEREARLTAFAGGIDGVHRVDYNTSQAREELEERAIWSDEIPTAVRQLGKADETYDSLPRFWHQVGVMYQNGEAHEITPDPHLATGIIPPLTSTFRDLSNSRAILPNFDPITCTGCGDCWTYCPDSAIGPLVIGARKLIDIGVRMTQLRELRPIAIRLASDFHRICADKNNTQGTVAELLRQTQISSDSSETEYRDGDAKDPRGEAMEKLQARIGSIPIARTARFFTEPEQEKAGSGELLSIIINPNTCKACGICIDACEPNALASIPQTPERIDQARRLWRIWEHLPEVTSETVARLGRNTRFNAMASLFFSRQFLLTMSGGDGAEAGSGEKIAVRFLVSAVEAHQQPLVERFLAELEQARKDITASIQNTLTDALPTNDLDTLAIGLASVHPGQVPLTVLTKHLETAEDAGIVDTARLRRLVELTRSLGDLHWEITNGRHGLGRARFGLAVGPGSIATWAGAYPNNPFHVPVAIDMTGETAQLAAGLFEGQLRKTIEGIRLLREAYNELDTGAGRHFPSTRTGGTSENSNSDTHPLSWSDLTVRERQLCPPVILLGNNEMLGGRGLAAILWLLRSDSPFKILIVSELDLGLDAVVSATDTEGVMVDAPFSLAKTPRINIGLLALAQYRAYVAQTSIADPRHFLDSVRAAMEYTGPALLHVHAPSPERHGFPMQHTIERARDAVHARVFPLFRYDPRAQGVFGLRIDLAGNPDPNLLWTTSDQEPFTPAHWALGEGRFAERFLPISDEEDSDGHETLPLAEYLEQDAKVRANKIPIIHRAGSDGEPAPYRVDSGLANATQDRRETWRILQELAGLVTPFTEEVEKRAEQRAAALREMEHKTLRQDHEAEVTGLRETMETEMAKQLHARLMQLAGLT
uniref:Pyruvate-ferredoxin/flavodoxin oxidoreductase n=1 Tax=Candidatus Kentrum sp. SD TaxID=2126332 RepID=A0A450YE41_9GAMM|nr:MAG: pyruvate-ferredoxin/flavodoxin oxidoreductase [Candidatus Kentron sp. SD]VFK47306.1 MAG: pyruvate-ferredoxin/flavodoxin oxidoreductase [Candidatus Kentron sp. SD]VFK78425.1 MAG: pyruvate-ferredoxin/flavodoxin oxidoreductase [Candidatus Kentron sp. SD]